MFEVTYQEVNKRDEVVTKRKSFKTAAARDKFVERASQKDNFLCVLAYCRFPRNRSDRSRSLRFR